MTIKKWAPYVAAWRERRRRTAEALGLRVEAGQTTAHECRVQVERYGARQVWLFGSLAHRRFVHPGSDVDLAVEGLPPEEYFRAVAAI